MRRRRTALFTLLVLIGLIAVPVVLTWREMRQEQLNHALIVAVDRNDAALVRRLLHQGADANAADLPDDKRPVWKLLWDLLRCGSGQTTAHGKSALTTAILWYPEDTDPDNADIVRALAEAGANVNRQQRKSFYNARRTFDRPG
jgi:hypothetical protein